MGRRKEKIYFKYLYIGRIANKLFFITIFKDIFIDGYRFN